MWILPNFEQNQCHLKKVIVEAYFYMRLRASAAAHFANFIQKSLPKLKTQLEI